MKLVTVALLASTPRTGTTDGQPDPRVQFKLFQPWGAWTWYVIEYDPETGEAFGLVRGLELELGYFSLPEIAAVRGPGGLTIERDLHWNARPLSEVRAFEEHGRAGGA